MPPRNYVILPDNTSLNRGAETDRPYFIGLPIQEAGPTRGWNRPARDKQNFSSRRRKTAVSFDGTPFCVQRLMSADKCFVFIYVPVAFYPRAILVPIDSASAHVMADIELLGEYGDVVDIYEVDNPHLSEEWRKVYHRWYCTANLGAYETQPFPHHKFFPDYHDRQRPIQWIRQKIENLSEIDGRHVEIVGRLTVIEHMEDALPKIKIV